MKSELKDFIENWLDTKNISTVTITINEFDIQDNNEDDTNGENSTSSSTSFCLKLYEDVVFTNSIICCFKVLQKYKIHSKAICI